MHPRILLAFLAARAHCWLMVNLSSTRTPRSLSAELLSSRSTPRLYWWMGLFLPRCRTLHLSLLNLFRFLSAQLSYFLAESSPNLQLKQIHRSLWPWQIYQNAFLYHQALNYHLLLLWFSKICRLCSAESQCTGKHCWESWQSLQCFLFNCSLTCSL